MDERWQRLGRMIEAERTKRWRTRREFARVTGLGVRTLDDLENGRRTHYREATLTAVEVALDWVVGSCEQIVRGGTPEPARDAGLDLVAQSWPQLTPEARQSIVRLVQLAARGRW